MIRSIRKILGYKVGASDGEIGKVMDFLFDDRSWSIRYIVVDAGSWLVTQPVLISPEKFDEPEWDSRILCADLTIQQIKNCPDISSDPPVAQQEKINLERQILIPPGSPVGYPIHSSATATVEDPGYVEDELASSGDPCLRSTKEVLHYTIDASDGEIGRVNDFIVEMENWIIRYMIVDTRNWFPGGKKVIISPSWIDRVNWKQSRVHVNLTCSSIKNSPEFNPSAPVNREYESKLYDYYGRPVYWEIK
jgi:hypothetical protein